MTHTQTIPNLNGYPQGNLLDINTGEQLKWTKLKNCSPIFNINEKRLYKMRRDWCFFI